MIFVNSMSDLFHEDVPAEFIHSVFETMNIASQHTFQVLTKRSDRLRRRARSAFRRLRRRSLGEARGNRALAGSRHPGGSGAEVR